MSKVSGVSSAKEEAKSSEAEVVIIPKLIYGIPMGAKDFMRGTQAFLDLKSNEQGKYAVRNRFVPKGYVLKNTVDDIAIEKEKCESNSSASCENK